MRADREGEVRRPKEPAVITALRAAILAVPGVTGTLVGVEFGDRPIAKVFVGNKESVAVWRWFRAQTKWMARDTKKTPPKKTARAK